jgi:hypothetical protein
MDFGTTHDFRVRRPRCPRCRAKLNAAAGGKQRPVTGDLSVCVYCGELLKFIDDDGRVVTLSTEEFSALPSELRAQLLRVVRAIEDEEYGGTPHWRQP